MLTTDRERNICNKYSARDVHGYVHCCECPLRKGDGYDTHCKANSRYNRQTKEWEFEAEDIPTGFSQVEDDECPLF